METEDSLKIDLRCTLNLENILRGVFHPTGMRRAMEGLNATLELGPIQSQINTGVGSAIDIVKYVPPALMFVRAMYDCATLYS